MEENVRLVKGENGKWNVFLGAEWYFEGTYEQAQQVYDSFFWQDEE